MSLSIPGIIDTSEKRHTLAVRHMISLLREAAKEQPRARSYRGFKVGCVLLTVNQFEGVRYARGVNIKLHEGAHKQCAEMSAFSSAARHDECFWVIAVAIFGKPMNDDYSNLKSDTLHSCVRCRELFVALAHTPVDPKNPALGKMMWEDALFFTSVPGRFSQHGELVAEPIQDTHTLHEMLVLHGHKHACCYASNPSNTTQLNHIGGL